MRDRAVKVADGIRKELSALLRELKDPRIGMVSIVSVELSNDLRHARVYASVYGDGNEQEGTLAALKRARGFLRGELARRLRLRFAPELDFRLDQSMEHGDRIHRLLLRLEEEESEAGNGREEGR